jgi:hypothetical protein
MLVKLSMNLGMISRAPDARLLYLKAPNRGCLPAIIMGSVLEDYLQQRLAKLASPGYYSER